MRNFFLQLCYFAAFTIGLIVTGAFYSVVVAATIVVALIGFALQLAPLALCVALLYYAYLGFVAGDPTQVAAGAIPATILIGMRERK